jgi:hypothetical protein
MDALDRTFQHLVQTIQARYPAYLTQPFEVAELYQNILPYRHHRRELGLETNQDYELVLLQLLAGARDYLIIDEQMRERLSRELASPNPDPGAFREFSTVQVALSPTAVRHLQQGTFGQPEPAFATVARPAPSETTQKITTQRAAAAAATAAHAPAAKTAAPAPVTASAPAPVVAGRRAAVPTAPSPQAAAQRAAPAAAPAIPAPSQPVTPPRATAAAPAGRPSNTIVPQAEEQCRYCSGSLPAGRRITFCPHCGQNLTVINCLACGTELELGWKFCTTCGRPVSAH